MGAAKGIALRGLMFLLRAIQFCCAAIVLALFSYFLATLTNHNMHIPTWARAVAGISGVGVLYTILALLMLCCVPGRSFPSFITMVLDVAFIGGFIYIATANRGGASSCNGEVDTVYGKGDANTNVVDNGSGGFTALPSLRTACKMESACLAVSIVAVILFAITPFVSLALVRHRRKEARFGPSPANNYTEGYGRRKRFNWFGLGRKRTAPVDGIPDPNALPQHSTPEDLRNSYATEQTRVGSGGGYGGLGNGSTKSPYGAGNDIPLGSYPNGSAGYRYDNPGVYHR
ncbi:hypothetical protein MYCTH_2300924 [Thermothelomyces thermophilus ATCC 42464]|uniref:MARVEL domain-containing protein n=1 Tax=Thermothelomyces thermophilus (strain ATCC 42464 / BCRC 31852 / DSM 1799) TaxID=573729 RepID=G2Q8I3_THET4|nr:uncharacterized protein MYCTH_2300924 [Thermothelomyces thermophilus ATCC 42464]AEO56232.1 hypothetical protein MYCTH_2300924 [Thermothelomyces thermophilus ATCC 42464]